MVGLNYVQVFGQESRGDLGSFGVKILVATDHADFTNEENTALDEAFDVVEDVFRSESLLRHPEQRARAKEEKVSFLSLFADPILVDEVPNGYCDRWCCKHLPWFKVTTRAGVFTIGWRKSVIHVEWDRGRGAEELFPDEDVTKFGRTIHAWGYEKAREYVGKVVGEAGK